MNPKIMISVHIVRVIAFCFFLARSAFASTTATGSGADLDGSSLANFCSLLSGVVMRSCDAFRFRKPDDASLAARPGLCGVGGRVGNVGWKRLVGRLGERERRGLGCGRRASPLGTGSDRDGTGSTGTVGVTSIGDNCGFSVATCVGAGEASEAADLLGRVGAGADFSGAIFAFALPDFGFDFSTTGLHNYFEDGIGET